MAAAAAGSQLTESMEDEIWMIMHMVAEMGAHPEATTDVEKKHLFMFEGELEDDDVEDQDERKKAMIETAEKLAKAADEYDKQQAQKKLEQEITAYILQKAQEINTNHGALITNINVRPSDALFQAGVLSTVYGFFCDKMEKALFGQQGFTQLALISSVTKGVARGFKDSSPNAIPLVSALATKFIKDKYGSDIAKNGGLIELISKKQ